MSASLSENVPGDISITDAGQARPAHLLVVALIGAAAWVTPLLVILL